MKIDNFDQIAKYMLSDSDEFIYFCQVLRRGKDHPDMPAANYVVKSFYLKGRENLMKHKDEIVKLCETFGARAYIHLARRSNEKCMLNALNCYSKRLYDGDYKSPHRIWNHAVGTTKPTTTVWVVDFDSKDENLLKEVTEYIEYLIKHNIGKKVLAGIMTILPTIDGFHIITSGFNSEEFNKKYPDITICKHGLALLYA